ncbi:hypothetical protein D3C72_1811340 [compost metagenome]
MTGASVRRDPVIALTNAFQKAIKCCRKPVNAPRMALRPRSADAQARRKQALTTSPVAGAGRLASSSRPPLRCMMRLTMDMPSPAPLASLRALSSR